MDNVVPIFVQPGDDGLFEFLELIGIGVVIETSPLIFQFHLVNDADDRVKYPELMTLEAVARVFVFNVFGVTCLKKLFGSHATGLQGFRVPPAVAAPVFTTSPLGKGPPGLPSISDGGFKARTNAMKCQNIKVLFHKNAAAFLEFAGPLEDTAGEHAIASIQSRVPTELLDLIILQPKHITNLARLMFQMVEGEGGLHLSMFRKPSVIVDSTYQLKRCFETFTEVLKAMVGDNGYLYDVFFGLLAQLASRASGGLCDMLPDILEHELSCRLVAFSKVLASATALTEDADVLSANLKIALYIDKDELERLNLRRLCASMSAQLDKSELGTGDKRKRDIDGDQADGDGVCEDHTKQSVMSGRPVNFCLSTVSFTFLGALPFDGRPPLAECADSECQFNHVIPAVPVSMSDKVRLVSLTKLIKNSPQRLTALLKVFNAANFSV